MIIRKANEGDINAIVGLGNDLFSMADYGEYAKFDVDSARENVKTILSSGVIFVAETGGEIIGQIIGVISPLWFNSECIAATEMCWIVKEDHKGSSAGVKLLREFEKWAKDNGAKIVCMSDLVIKNDTPAGGLFCKLGYSVVERSHIKRI